MLSSCCRTVASTFEATLLPRSLAILVYFLFWPYTANASSTSTLVPILLLALFPVQLTATLLKLHKSDLYFLIILNLRSLDLETIGLLAIEHLDIARRTS